jgi:hypothetical protein
MAQKRVPIVQGEGVKNRFAKSSPGSLKKIFSKISTWVLGFILKLRFRVRLKD